MSYHLATTSATALFASGGYAFYKTKSVPSLIGASALGTVFAASAYLVRVNQNHFVAHCLGAAAGLGCLVVGGRRYSVAKNKFAPILLLAIGCFNLPYHLYKSFEWF